jgi:hypothetical protein
VHQHLCKIFQTSVRWYFTTVGTPNVTRRSGCPSPVKTRHLVEVGHTSSRLEGLRKHTICWWLRSSGFWRRADSSVETKVSEKYIASIFRPKIETVRSLHRAKTWSWRRELGCRQQRGPEINTDASCSGGRGFISRSGDCLSPNFPQPLQANAGTISLFRSRPLSSTFFPVLYRPTIRRCTVWATDSVVE